MKKLVSLLLVLCLACAVVSATAEEASPVGTWYLVRGEKDGTVVQTAGMITMEFTFSPALVVSSTPRSSALAMTFT